MRWSIAILVAMSVIATTTPYALDRAWLWATAALLLGLFWISVPTHSYDWTASIGLIGFTLLGAAAVLRYSAVYWALPGVLAALAAWDLSNLTLRLMVTDDVRNRAVYLRVHLLQLSAVLMSAWLLSLLALRLLIPVGFLWALALVLLLVLGLAIVIRAARRTEAGAQTD